MNSGRIAVNAKRVIHEFVLLNPGTPQQVFPLLCPVREAEWLPQWKYRLVFSQSGVAELGAIFTTPNEDGEETSWVVTHYDPAKPEIAFAWVRPRMLATRLEIALSPAAGGQCRACWRYTYTALSAAGERDLERMDRAGFEPKKRRLEKAINHFLQYGTIISAKEWETA